MNKEAEKAFQLILNAGNSKSKSLMAIEEARESNFKEAEKLLQEASSDLRIAHQSQTDMIQSEAKGDKQEIDILLIHAQDHLTMATMAQDFAEEFICIYKIIEDIKEGVCK